MEHINQRVKFLDVGHGDSSIIYLTGDSTGISDSPENVIIVDIVDSDKLLAELQENNVKIIDLIIIDHCRGVNDFLKKFGEFGIVRNICFNLDRKESTRTLRTFLKTFLEIHTKQKSCLLLGQNNTSSQRRKLLSNSNSKLYLLYPNAAESTQAYLSNNTNNMSIVCLLENKACNVLFPGDLEEHGWKNLLSRMPDLKCDILKMPHHGAFYDGNNGMGSKQILEILEPKEVIISSGNNQKYKHPDQKTVELLTKEQIKVFCTEFTSLCHCKINEFQRKCYGDIEVIANEKTYKIKTEENNALLLSQAECMK